MWRKPEDSEVRITGDGSSATRAIEGAAGSERSRADRGSCATFRWGYYFVIDN